MRRTLLLATLLLGLTFHGAAAQTPPALTAQALWEAWPRARVSPADPWALKHAGLRKAIAQLQAAQPGLFTLEEEGLSSEGRKIPVLHLGTGPTGVLLWSQMHGDEPTATLALLDLLSYLGSHRQEAAVRRLLGNLSLWIVPMLNPDGAERTQRRNAQEVDINRDALRLVTPEGRFLKALRDRVRPVLGYNLHNQSPNLLAGKGGRQVAIALLSVPGGEALSETPGTRRTKQLALTVQRLTETLAPGRVARYDMDYTARAFGDAMTRWGTATLLIETGGWAGPGEAERLVRLNFVALLGSLSALAEGAVDAVDAPAYGQIPLNVRDELSSLLLRNLRLAGGRSFPTFRADLAFVVPGPFAGDAQRRREPGVVEVGDLSHAQGLLELDATGLLALPCPLPEAPRDWPALQKALSAQGLLRVGEAKLMVALQAMTPALVLRPGYTGAVLLYGPDATGQLSLRGAVLRGKLVGDGLVSVPAPPSPRLAQP